MSQNGNDENGVTWTWRVKVPQAAIGAIMSYLIVVGTVCVYSVTNNSQTQEASQSQTVKQVICPLQPQKQSQQDTPST